MPYLAPRPYTKALPMVAPITSWSGFYLGGFGGYGWSNSVRASVPGVGAASFSTSDINGGFGGGTFGYNWQSPGSQFVWGLEVDAAAADISDNATALGVTGTEKVDAFGSVTGVSASPSTHGYSTQRAAMAGQTTRFLSPG